MNHSDRVSAGVDWEVVAAGNGLAAARPNPIRRIVCHAAGNLYLVPIGGAAGAGTLFGPVLAGQAVDQQCADVGASTTVDVTVQW